MCQTCALTQTFDSSRHANAHEATNFAAFTESEDAAASAETQYTMSQGDTFSGALSFAGDNDWVAITMTVGESYDIALSGDDRDNNGLTDPTLRLYNSAGTLVAEDDDGGDGLDSFLSYTATRTGTYYIAAQSFENADTGSYRIAIEAGEPRTQAGAGSLDELARFLTHGYWEGDNRSFDTSDSSEITVNIRALSASEKQLARWAFEAWELVADIQFVEVSGTADITFDNDDSGAYATSSTFDGTITRSNVNVSSDWADDYGTTISSYTFSTYIHEIGHALGLGHQGAYNGAATYGEDDTFTNDSYQVSVMSYFSQTDNTSVEADYADPISAMMADIVAIQNLYGAAGSDSQSAGNTIWGEGTNLTGYMADVLNSVDGSRTDDLGDEPVTFTIYDYDGIDWIILRSSTADNALDMNGAGVSDIGGRTGNVMIARDTVIENASLGRGNDTVIGNEANNKILGRRGNDELSGGSGRDKLTGGSGADELNGGTGRDTLSGGSGRDELNGGTGRDALSGGSGRDELNGDSGRDALSGGSGRDTLNGGAGRDTLSGGSGHDRIWGNSGSDELSGGTGNDVLVGGGASDAFIFERGFDRDTIRDFKLGVDRLVLDTELTDGLETGAEVWDSFGSIRNDKAILNFGDGDVLKLLKVTDIDILVDDMVFV